MPQIRVKLSNPKAAADGSVALKNAELTSDQSVDESTSSSSAWAMSTKVDCFGDFASVNQLGELVDIDRALLKKACDDYKTMVSDDEQLLVNKANMIRATHFPLHDLEAVIAQSREAGSAYVKVYMGIDADGDQFMFSAPIDASGKALVGSTILALACVKIPPCPAANADIFISDSTV